MNSFATNQAYEEKKERGKERIEESDLGKEEGSGEIESVKGDGKGERNEEVENLDVRKGATHLFSGMEILLTRFDVFKAG